MLRPNSRSCRTASIRSGIAGGLAGEVIFACLLSRLSEGMPGVAAFRRAVALAALESGITSEQLEASGLGDRVDRNNTKVAGAR
jgi:hypothetical protein